VPLGERVDVQSEIAPPESVIDGQWVAVGTSKPYAVQKDFTLLFNGQPSYRFELGASDNTLKGYGANETKGRAELCYCYATQADVAALSQRQLDNAVDIKKVYFYGKGRIPQGSHMFYRFSVYVPHDLSDKVCTIFAQWHGMPDRTLLKTPDGTIKKVSDEEFSELCKTMTFDKTRGAEKILLWNKDGSPKIGKNGRQAYKAGADNGWMVEQGGYPPLAFGFSDGWFYIKANSDRKWLSDNDDRTNASPAKDAEMQPVKSRYRTSVVAYKLPFGDFPKDRWITFDVEVEWSQYGGEKETIARGGNLDVEMTYPEKGKTVSKHVVDHQPVLIGRNDEQGYYFKFGIYRVAGSTEPVQYNLAGFSQSEKPIR
jgi:heparin lyase